MSFRFKHKKPVSTIPTLGYSAAINSIVPIEERLEILHGQTVIIKRYPAGIGTLEADYQSQIEEAGASNPWLFGMRSGRVEVEAQHISIMGEE